MTPDKVDTNQSDIVKALRKIPGVTVVVGHDDIIVGYKKKNFWFELKSPSCVSPKTGKIQPSKIKVTQYALLDNWQGHYSIVWNLKQILSEIGAEA